MPSEKFVDSTISGYAVKVMWGADSDHVQVATIDPEAPEPTDHDPNGLHVYLNRSQINALIRTLRRARDASFGRDE